VINIGIEYRKTCVHAVLNKHWFGLISYIDLSGVDGAIRVYKYMRRINTTLR
jgi:hypothetical protein